MLEKILEAVLDPQPRLDLQAARQPPIDPVSWIDDVFNDGWMTFGSYGDFSNVDVPFVFNSGLDGLY